MGYCSEELTEGIFQIKDELDNCSTLVLGKEKALLFDTSIGTGDLKSYINTLTDLPLIVVNSHGHLDHMGNNYQFGNIYISYKDLGLKASNKYCTDEIEKLQKLDLSNGRKMYDEKVNYIDLTEGMQFELGGLTAEALSLPGHTAGSMGIWLKEKRIILVGDAVSPQMCIFMDGAQELKVYEATLNKLLKIDFDFFIVGHYMRLFTKGLLYSLLESLKKVKTDKGYKYQYSLVPSYGGKMFFSELNNPETNDIICIIVADELAERYKNED